ncbi:helix-turn-helix domain-containing protein [Nocardiopsis rhodophaea]|uniref:Helix-turn-helix domain-containing protein n=1 Tax=Nocardiopsis rhodophaea TaxID=280238 RepID=A0ABN2S4V9_9ACTN
MARSQSFVTASRGLGRPTEVAEYLGVPERTLSQWRYLEKGPKWSKVGRHVRYRWSDVEAWLDANQGGEAA